MDPRARRSWTTGLFALSGVLLGGLLMGSFATRSCSTPALPSLPPLSSSVTVVHPTPNVLLAVQDLARLESASFHMERVVDLSDKQSHLFGLVQSEDAILLVAVANVTAGIDLSALTAGAIDANPEKKSVKIKLPAPYVFSAELDDAKTYVHFRHTGLLAQRKENLETKARSEAKRMLTDAALEAGILSRAGENARRSVEGLVRGLGYEQVEVSVATASPAEPK